MDKATVVKQNMVQHTNLEVEILTTMTAAGHPFFVHLYDAFQTSQKLILAMEVRSITKSSTRSRALAHTLLPPLYCSISKAVRCSSTLPKPIGRSPRGP